MSWGQDSASKRWRIFMCLQHHGLHASHDLYQNPTSCSWLSYPWSEIKPPPFSTLTTALPHQVNLLIPVDLFSVFPHFGLLLVTRHCCILDIQLCSSLVFQAITHSSIYFLLHISLHGMFCFCCRSTYIGSCVRWYFFQSAVVLLNHSYPYA